MEKAKIVQDQIRKISTEQMLMGTSGNMYWKDTEGRIVWCNLQQANAMGFQTVEEAIGKADYDIFEPEIAKSIIENDKKVIETGLPVVTHEVGKIAGVLKAFISHKTPIKDENGKVTGIFGMSIDVTGQKGFGVTIPQKRYKARLNHVPKEDADFLKARSCVIGISLNNPSCHGEKLRALLRLVNLRFKECTVVVCDSLYRHNLAVIHPDKTEQELIKMALGIGDVWIENHKEILSELTISHKIARWDEYICNESFDQEIAKVHELYNSSSEYRDSVTKMIDEFLLRSFRQGDDLDKELYFNSCKHYLLEEIAVMLSWFHFDYLIYPSKRLDAVDFTFESLASEISKKKLLHLEVRFASSEMQDSDYIESLPLYKIIENMPGHIYWKDKYGTLLGCNLCQANILGYDRIEDIIGKTDFDFLSEEFAMEVRKNDLEVMNSRKLQVVEEIGESEFLTKRTVLSYKMPLQNSHGAVVGLVGVSLDITKQKELEAELAIKNDALRDALQGRDEFLRNMTHEIKTPLACILKMSNMLYDNWNKYPDNDSRKAHLKVAVDSNKRLKGVLFNIMDLSRSEAGKMTYEKESYSLKDSVMDVADEFIDERHRINVIIEEGKFFGYFDHHRIEQVIRNLLSNAFRYGGTGTITIRLKEVDGVMQFSISDEGVGIPNGELEKIFDIFTQSTRTKTSAGGTGIGLSICRNIIAAHDGKIWVENNANGVGCTFHFYIPAVDVVVSPKVKSDDVDTKIMRKEHNKVVAKKPLALVIDDDESVLAMTNLVLESIGFDVILAESGMEGLEKLSENKDEIDVVLLDVMIPDVYGLEILRRIRASDELKHLQVYIHSSVNEGDKVLVEASEIGISGVIDKMMSAQEIAKTLSEFLK